jgi:L-threonylcarbamoyladenylate synthase
MKTKFLKINPKRPEKEKIRIAARVIKRGGLVIFPTETVYGIGADALNQNASKKIFKVKGRPSDNPLMIHVSDMEMTDRIGIIPKKYRAVVKRVWPGPIAFVIEAKSLMKRKEIAIRMPDNKIALALIRESGTPIAAPSANISKKPSSTNAKHAKRYFDSKVDVIIDGGPTEKGIESTILDLRTFTILRPGAFTVEMITKEFDRKPLVTDEAKGIRESKIAISPGMKYMHYSPDTPLFLYAGKPEMLPSLVMGLRSQLAFIGSSETCVLMRGKCMRMMDLGPRKKPELIAQRLFDALIKLDESNMKFAIIEGFDEKGIGLGIMNRIRKASNHKTFKNRSGLDRLLGK